MNTNKISKVDYLIASRLLKTAWQKVESETISNCFAKAGFFPYVEPETSLFESDSDIATYWPDISKNVAYDEYLNIDEKVSTFGRSTDNEIVAEVLNKKICHNETSDEEGADDIENKAIPKVS